MNKKSLIYTYPILYVLALKIVHRGNFSKRYRYMTRFVKAKDLVLEPACGPAILADYLPKQSQYFGFDTNEDFIKFALKKKRNVYKGNVLDKKSYKPADVVITCDILHHLKPTDRKRFVKHCFSSAKKAFIICEPVQFERKKGIRASFKNRLMQWNERDGVNQVRPDFFPTRRELTDDIKNGFGIISSQVKRKTREFGQDIVAVFLKS